MPNGPKYLVVGGAGFIGSHLTDRLIERGTVTIYDNLTIGKREFVADALASGRAALVQADALDLESLVRA
ncbi:MAG TPA: NAD-dependent epimerase/dehydratase family protein, partial [Polyangiaceae bacterium]